MEHEADSSQHQAEGEILAHGSARTAVDFTTDLSCARSTSGCPCRGVRICWAVVGRKHVRIRLPVCNTRFRMTREQWDRSPVQGHRLTLKHPRNTTPRQAFRRGFFLSTISVASNCRPLW